MRIVADTNLLIASIFWSGAPYKIVQQALDGKIEIVTSKDILNEVRKVLKDPEEEFVLSEQEIDDIVNGILLYAKLVEPAVTVDVVKRDPKDNPIIACALTAKAEFIVTRDKDLLVLKEYAGIKILTPEEFLKY
jgi:putative PIN family toxin of toxin-antitoxin system